MRTFYEFLSEQNESLTKAQKYSIASTLATSNLQSVITKMQANNMPPEAIEFAKSIDRYYKKRDGFVPQKVLQIININK